MSRANLKDMTIVFDLDGTLVDTAPDLTNALNDALIRRGHRPIPQETIRQAVGFGARVMIEEALHRAGALEDIDAMLADFLVHYEANIAAESRPFPGAVASLDALAASGARLAVCTNKTEAFSKKLLFSLGMAQRFAAVCGQDSFAFRKPDPRHLTATIAAAGGDLGRALMVGDSVTDIDAAKAAGIPVVAVDFGYTDRHVREFEPSKVISHFDELTVALAERLMAAAAETVSRPEAILDFGGVGVLYPRRVQARGPAAGD